MDDTALQKRIVDLMEEHGGNRRGSIIACLPILVLVLLTLLTGYAWQYGLSCWLTILAVGWMSCWYTRTATTQTPGERLRYLIDLWLEHVSKSVVGRWLVITKTRSGIIIASVMLWHEQVGKVTGFSYPLGGWVVRMRVHGRLGKLHGIRLKHCHLDKVLGILGVTYIDAASNKPHFTDLKNAFEWQDQVHPEDEVCWPGFERMAQAKRELSERELERQRELVRQPTPRLLPRRDDALETHISERL